MVHDWRKEPKYSPIYCKKTKNQLLRSLQYLRDWSIFSISHLKDEYYTRILNKLANIQHGSEE